MERIAIIPARGGSRRLPGKNWKEFFGRPIIEYTIDLALSMNFTRVIVSSDAPEVREIVERYPRSAYLRWHNREHPFNQDGVGTQTVAAAVLRGLTQPGQLLDGGPTDDDFACVIYPTAGPLIDASAFEGYLFTHIYPDAWPITYSMAVGTSPLRDAGQWYIGKVQHFLDHEPLLTPQTRICPVPECTAIDINTPEDWEAAESAYRTHVLKPLGETA